MFKKIISFMGMTPATVAQQLSSYGDPNEIQRAIENGDYKSLSFIGKAAEAIRQKRPDLYSQVESMFNCMR